MMWGGADTMTKAELLAAEIRKYCEKHAKPELADKYRRYFSEGYAAWGGFDKDHPIWNAQEEEWFEKYRGMGLRGVSEAGRDPLCQRQVRRRLAGGPPRQKAS